MPKFLIYSTTNSQYFAKLIASQLGIKLSTIIRGQFGDGELYHRFDINDDKELFGKTAIFVTSTNTDQDFNELEKIGIALADYGTARRIFVIPFFGYSTMERAVKPGEIVSAKINARRLSNIPGGNANIFLMLDLHVSSIIHYFEGDCLRYELFAEKILTQAIEELKIKNFIFGTADLGKTKWVEIFANKFFTDIAFIRKSRDYKKTKILDVIGQVKGKNIIIYDDMTRSGGTLIQAARAYRQNGAEKIYAVLSHLALNDKTIITKLIKSPIEKIISTNSHPMSQHSLIKRSKKFIIKDVSLEFTEVIKKF